MSNYNACIASIRMENINEITVGLQRQVVAARNLNKYPHYDLNIQGPILPVGKVMDFFWRHNAAVYKHDIVVFLDIDAIPLTDDALDLFIEHAAEGNLVGNAQRSNHIDNHQHMFAAPSAVAMSQQTYDKLGHPSAEPTKRGDVGEEWTYAAEAYGVPVQLLMPIKWERPVIRMPWETDQRPTWQLAEGYPDYALGTEFGSADRPQIYHHFQIFHNNHQQLFQDRCRAELKQIEESTVGEPK